MWCVCTGLFKSSAEETDADVNKTCKQAKINSSDKTELMRMRMMKIVMTMMEIVIFMMMVIMTMMKIVMAMMKIVMAMMEIMMVDG